MKRGPSKRAAQGTLRQARADAAALLVDRRGEAAGRPEVLAAALQALQVMDGAVALDDALLVEAGLLELAVDVAGEDEGAVRQPAGDVAQDAEASVALTSMQQVPVVQPMRTPPCRFRSSAAFI